mgnify:FL=1
MSEAKVVHEYDAEPLHVRVVKRPGFNLRGDEIDTWAVEWSMESTDEELDGKWHHDNSVSAMCGEELARLAAENRALKRRVGELGGALDYARRQFLGIQNMTAENPNVERPYHTAVQGAEAAVRALAGERARAALEGSE